MTAADGAPVVDLEGRTVLLTGASGGIGSVTARELLGRGANLIAHYGHRRDEAQAACARAPSDRYLLVATEMARPGAARELWAQALEWRGRVDAVVLNAAIMPDTHIDGSDADWDEGWEQAMRVNVIEPASLAREAVRHFTTSGGGTLVALSSWAAQRGSAIGHLSAYASSKAAVRTLAQTIARNHARDGILSYAIAPGIVRTPMSEISAIARGGIEALNAELAMGEMVEPDEVARVIAFLLSGAAPNLTGATLDLNGATYVR